VLPSAQDALDLRAGAEKGGRRQRLRRKEKFVSVEGPKVRQLIDGARM